MSRARIRYRVRQFWKALSARPERQDLALARAVLGARPMDLFLTMQPGEQMHSLEVYRQVAARLQAQPVEGGEDLLVAALLHDAGKTCHPLSLWERVVIVLGKAIVPVQVKAWGEFEGPASSKIPAWRRAFIVASQHARWGAEMAAHAGVTPQAVRLISRHQDHLPGETAVPEDRLLKILQTIDDQL